jgi:sterol desaturase/sphingolipid hydroxylase (fatty acid hydroxylase superfamily)
MHARLAFFRHPKEIIFNSMLFIGLSTLLDISSEALWMARVIKGCVECFHHLNIRIPRGLRPLGWVIQLGEIHLVHHQYGDNGITAIDSFGIEYSER